MEEFELAYRLYEPPSPAGGVLVDSAVLYLDTLGVKAMCIAQPVRIQDEKESTQLGSATSPSAEEHLRRLRQAVNKARSQSEMDLKIGRHATVHFTDNVVVGVPMGPWDENPDGIVAEAILMAGKYSWAFSVSQQSTRGALTLGPHFMAAGFAFGPALVQAVEMEQEKWRASEGYPACVRVDQSIVDAVIDPLHALHGAIWTFNDDFHFVSPLDVIAVSAWVKRNEGMHPTDPVVAPDNGWHLQIDAWVNAVRQRRDEKVPKADWVAAYTDAWLAQTPEVGIAPQSKPGGYVPYQGGLQDWAAVTERRTEVLRKIAGQGAP